MRTFLITLVLMLAAPLAAQDAPEQTPEDDLDRLSLASLLIGDGNYARARGVLAAVDQDDPELDAVRYHSLDGLVALNLDELPRASRPSSGRSKPGENPNKIRQTLSGSTWRRRVSARKTTPARSKPSTGRTPRPPNCHRCT